MTASSRDTHESPFYRTYKVQQGNPVFTVHNSLPHINTHCLTEFLHCTMGCLASKPSAPVEESTPMRPITRTMPAPTPPQPASEPPAQVSRAPSQSRSRRGSTASTRSTKDPHEPSRTRTASAPQRVPSMSSQNPRSARYQTVAVPSTGIRTANRPRLSTPGKSDA